MKKEKIIFVSHCILNQYVRKNLRNNLSSKNEILEVLLDSKIGINQLPCPEIEFNGKANVEFNTNSKEYKEYCKKLSSKISKTIKKYLKANFDVVGILGVDFSPTCAVYRISDGKRIKFKKGILIEEIEKQMQKENFQVPIFSVNLNNVLPTVEKLNLLLKNS